METQSQEDTKVLIGGVSEHPALPSETERLASIIVDSAFRVHSTIGPGLIESFYEACLCHELSKRRVAFRRQVAFPITYDGLRFDAGLRIDLLVSELVIVELKAVDIMHPVFEAQLLSYLKLTGLRLGLLINFNVRLIKDGIKRIII
jgi:GxxExxY protein